MRATMVLLGCLGLLGCGPRYEIEVQPRSTEMSFVYRVDTWTGEICLFTVAEGQIKEALCGPGD